MQQQQQRAPDTRHQTPDPSSQFPRSPRIADPTPHTAHRTPSSSAFHVRVPHPSPQSKSTVQVHQIPDTRSPSRFGLLGAGFDEMIEIDDRSPITYHIYITNYKTATFFLRSPSTPYTEPVLLPILPSPYTPLCSKYWLTVVTVAFNF